MHIEGRSSSLQGEPLSMSIYGIAILPLIRHLYRWSLQTIVVCWRCFGWRQSRVFEGVVAETRGAGPCLRISPQSIKDLAVGEEAESGSGQRHFPWVWHQYNICRSQAPGSVLGSDDFLEALVKAMISTFADKLEQLCKIAKTEPQAAYSALIHGVISKWTYLMHTTPGIAPLMTPLDWNTFAVTNSH